MLVYELDLHTFGLHGETIVDNQWRYWKKSINCPLKTDVDPDVDNSLYLRIILERFVAVYVGHLNCQSRSCHGAHAPITNDRRWWTAVFICHWFHPSFCVALKSCRDRDRDRDGNRVTSDECQTDWWLNQSMSFMSFYWLFYIPTGSMSIESNIRFVLFYCVWCIIGPWQATVVENLSI